MRGSRGLVASLAAGAVALAALAGIAQAASERSAVSIRVVARGLSSPIYVTGIPGTPGRLLVVEQGGKARVLHGGAVVGTFLDVSRKIVSGGEQGLLGLAFHPDFPKTPRVYVNYTNRGGDTRVVEYRTQGLRALPGSARVVLAVDQPYSNHNGGHLAFGPDGALYVGLGDGGAGGDPENRSQDMGTLLGKMVRIDVDGDRKPTIAALGLRNPWRYSFDRRTGDLWIGDVGQGGIEEIDFLAAGRAGLINYGWDVYEGRRPFEAKELGPGTLVQPISQYTHGSGCSVTGGYVYRGSRVPAAKGRYYYGDYCSGTVWSFRRSGARAVAARREPFRVEGLVSFGEDLAGELYLVAHSGTIYRLAG